MPTGYRVEISPNARAGCKNTECKKSGEKIQKGELRLGTLVTVMEHTTWAYKHWGCFTPEQIKNMNSFLEGDMDLLEGYDELSAEWQDKISRALKNGHIDDEDWRGDVEMNRPGMKGFRVKASKKTPKNKADELDEEAEASPKPKKKTPKNKANELDEETEAGPKPKKRARAAKDEDHDEAPAPKKARGKKPVVKEEDAVRNKAKPAKAKSQGKKAAIKDEDAANAEPEPKPKKARGKKAAVKEEVTEEEESEVEVPKPKRGKKKAPAAASNEKLAPQKRSRKKKTMAGDE